MLAAVNRCVVNVLDLVYSDDSDSCSVEAQTVCEVLGEHVHFDCLVSSGLKSVGFQYFFDRLNFLDDLFDLFDPVDTSTEVERVVPIQLCF